MANSDYCKIWAECDYATISGCKSKECYIPRRVDAPEPASSSGSDELACSIAGDCADWIEGMRQIVEMQNFMATTGRGQYTARAFKFCPWCGAGRSKRQ